MSVSHVNRQGKTYFLQQSQTKTGAITYSFTTKLKKTPVDTMPDGFEIYERPETGQVYLRKPNSSSILPIEKELAERALRQDFKYANCVDVQNDSLVIYVAGGSEIDDDPMINYLVDEWLGESRRQEIKQRLRNMRPLVKMLRLTLTDKHERLFRVERCCFRGSIDDWIDLEYGLSLPMAIGLYFKHLEQESFFELI